MSQNPAEPPAPPAVDISSEAAPRDSFKCKARPSLPAGPQDCDWPECGCDPAANRVLAHLQECGFTILDEATWAVTLSEAREALEPFAEVSRWAKRNNRDLLQCDALLRSLLPGEGFLGHLGVSMEDFIKADAVLAKLSKGA